jgi:hypothetical protein
VRTRVPNPAAALAPIVDDNLQYQKSGVSTSGRVININKALGNNERLGGVEFWIGPTISDTIANIRHFTSASARFATRGESIEQSVIAHPSGRTVSA